MILLLQFCQGATFDNHCAQFVTNSRVVPARFQKIFLKEITVKPNV